MKAYDDEQVSGQLAEALTHLPDEWVVCRDMRHAWRIQIDFHVTDGTRRFMREVRRTLVCTRCETQRMEVYHVVEGGVLDKVSQNYAYPDDYQMKGVPRGVKPASIVQTEQFRRAMERAVESIKKAATELGGNDG